MLADPEPFQFTFDKAMRYLAIPKEWVERLQNMYSRPERKYHNVSHIESVLRWLRSDSYPEPALSTILNSILFHDIFYKVGQVPPGYNEAMSIALYCNYLNAAQRAKAMAGDDRYVIEAINATAYHLDDQKYLSTSTKLVLDLDLQSFAQPWLEYEADCDKVRAELTQTYTPMDYDEGRLNFLKAMLSREKIYYMHTEWEEPARANLSKSVHLLEK